MDYVNLGASGLKVSRLCLGMMGFGDRNVVEWSIDEAAAEPIVRAAVDAGINFFDTANAYSAGASEVITGHLLSKMLPRDEFVVATKVFLPVKPGPNGGGLSRKHIMWSIDESLRRLGMDHVDLYQIHRFDSTVPVEETMEALHDLVKAGKVRYLGASSMWAWQFAKLQHAAERHGWTKFVSMQNHYNLLYREEEREMIPLCRDQGVGMIPWGPLAAGVLAGNRSTDGTAHTDRAKLDRFNKRRYTHPGDVALLERVAEVAAGLNVPMAQLALAWMLTKPGITAPIVGTTKQGQLEDAVASLTVELSADDVARLEELYRPHPVQGHL